MRIRHDPPVSAARSAIMRSVAQKDTTPELLVRRVLHGLGLRFRLHVKDLAGTPDIVLSRHNTVIFVHGCFWHRHSACPRATFPRTRVEFWEDKFRKNIERDEEKARDLRELGWRVVTVWECETRNLDTLKARLRKLFSVG